MDSKQKIKFCKECGQEMTGAWPTKVFCSDRCQIKSAKKRSDKKSLDYQKSGIIKKEK